MPTTVRWLLRSAFFFLLCGVGVGLWLLAGKSGMGTFYYGLVPVHTHLLLFGFVMQLVFGIAIWMFPRIRGRGTPPWLGWSILTTGSGGTLLRAVCGTIIAVQPDRIRVLAKWVFVGGSLQTVAVILAIITLTPRIRGLRKAKG